MNKWKTATLWTLTVVFAVLTLVNLVSWTVNTFLLNNENSTIVKIVTPTVKNNVVSENKTAQKVKQVENVKIQRENIVVLLDQIGVNALDIAAEITEKANKSNGSPIYLLISSPGGSVLDGALIINAMEASPVPVHTVCLDLCASMAAIIHQYGNKRMMVDRSILMFHDARGQFSGPFPHIKSNFTAIDRYITRFNEYISVRTGMSLNDLLLAEHNEMWIDAEDSLQKNFTDKLVFVHVLNNHKNENFESFMEKYRTSAKNEKPLSLTW